MMEKKGHRTIKKILFGCILVILSMPMLFHFFSVHEFWSLRGAIKPTENPVFSAEGWFDGSYQKQKEKYLNDSLGLRPVFVRLHNQLYYSIYSDAKANGVVVGKDGYLYEENYIKAHLGRDFIGDAAIKEKVAKLEKICDTLDRLGIQLMIVFAPGKGSFYPEFIPDRFEPWKKTRTNYDSYSSALNETAIHFLDFNAWFRSMKKTSPYTLVPKTGIHWSKYGEMIAADSIMNYISFLRPDKKLAQLHVKKIEKSKTMVDSDDDIEKGMNLLFNISDLEMGYPQFEFLKDSSENPPQVLAVADSYYWGMFNFGLSRDVFNRSQFWFYNEQIYPDSFKSPLNVRDIDIREGVERNDVVMLISTDANLYKFAFGFIDQLYEAYFGKK